MNLSFALIALLAAPLMAPQSGKPATAADSVPKKIRSVTVFGDDPCPKPTSKDEVVVCGRLDENERYRIPKQFRDDGTHTGDNESWVARARMVDDVNRVALPGSCSVVGAYGQTGCTQQMIREWQAYRAEQLRKKKRIP